MAGVEAARAANLEPPGGSSSLVNYAFIQRRNYQSIEREVPEAAVPSSTKLQACCQKGTYKHLVYFCALSVAAYAGVLIRIYLAKLAQWDSLPLFPSFYAEVVGTTIMGLTISHKKLLEGGIRHFTRPLLLDFVVPSLPSPPGTLKLPVCCCS